MSLQLLLNKHLEVSMDYDTLTQSIFSIAADYNLAAAIGKKLNKPVCGVVQGKMVHFVVYLYDDRYVDIFGIFQEDHLKAFRNSINGDPDVPVEIVPESEIDSMPKALLVAVTASLVDRVSTEICNVVNAM